MLIINQNDCDCSAPFFANTEGNLICSGCGYVLTNGADRKLSTCGISVHELKGTHDRNWFVNEWLKVKYNETIIV